MNVSVKQLNRKIIENQNLQVDDEVTNDLNKSELKKETKKKRVPDITRQKWFWDNAVLS
ncbi:hypothetical protein [Pelosinus sp. UFO1]|uniref:hypothetical protein n=1 Tax=Pelosinus sp. UFO1 TaxID=484770 RepID=UPI0004D11E7D|nr:hypothetical protein [Pelosinus sp. UFO1]AIF49929.1 hypothetical protein UFO1_0368 [Pelosinus sp. UFO1]